MNSGKRADLKKENLMLLHKKCRVLSTTFDGLSANLSMMKQLRGCYDLNGMKTTTFPYPCNPSIETAIFLDPSHMLKLVRNGFGDKNVFFS